MRLIWTTVLACAMVSPGALAKSKNKKKYEPRYGMAGCGIGSLVIKDKDRNSQIGVWAVNFGATYLLSSFSPTFAMTSGTSNCTDRAREEDSDEGAILRQEQEVYISANLEDIKKDAARGDGQFLDGLAEVFGCTSDQASVTLKQISRENFGQLFDSSEPSVIRDNYVQGLRGQMGSDEGLCQRII
jgi:hypothetical protein